MITLGILADTHIPDRLPRLHPRLLPVFREAGVQAILHAGDVTVPGVLSELETVAPVHAVGGNRDWVSLRRLPHHLRLEFGGVSIGLTHGHGNLYSYIWDKFHNLLFGLKPERYINYALSVFPDVDVVVFGHLHRAVNQWVDGQLVFDPGSASCPIDKNSSPSVGLLHIHDRARVEAEVVFLK